jgi:4-nitrophenyl phosphatase
MKRVDKIRAILIDLDGVIYRGNELLPGAINLFDWVESINLNYVLITNNSTKTPGQVATKLKNLGVKVRNERILTSAIATAHYLKLHAGPQTRIYAIGEEGLKDALIAYGFKITENTPDYIIVGLDRNFDFKKLEIAVNEIRNGAKFIATNADPVIATERGFEPGTGALVAMIESETGCKPIEIGKPSPWLFNLAINKANANPMDILMIGDNIDTDIRGAQAVGIVNTALIFSGVTTQSMVKESSVKPSFVFSDLDQLITDLLSI